MKKLMFGLMMAFAAAAEAEEVTIGGLKYTLDAETKTATIVGYDKETPPTVLDVSSVEYDGGRYDVTSVGEVAFQQCATLTFVSLPKATVIYENAFYECPKLTNAVLSSATSIGRCALARCETLESVALPLAETIGDFAFDACKGIKSISLPEATSIGGSAFKECSSLTKAFLPKVEMIEGATFNNCGITSLDLPSVTSIKTWAFYYSQNLSQISIPAATSVENDAFGYNDSLDVILTNKEMGNKLDNNRSDYGLKWRVKILTPTQEQVEQATLKVSYYSTIDGVDVCEEIYRSACAMHDLPPKDGPQVVQEGEIAVKETELQAPKAEAVSIADGVVTLTVNVCSNENFNAETKNWKKARILNATLNDDGTATLTVPVACDSGFMILQSGDAKVGQ